MKIGRCGKSGTTRAKNATKPQDDIQSFRKPNGEQKVRSPIGLPTTEIKQTELEYFP